MQHEVPQHALETWRTRGEPSLSAPAEANGGETAAVPPPEALVRPVQDWLAKLDSAIVPSVRSAMAGLARAYRGTQKLAEAASSYRLALAEEGEEPSEAALRAGLAITQIAGTEPQEGIRNLLLAIELAQGPVDLIVAVLTTLTPNVAVGLADWLGEIWLPDVERSCPAPVIAVGQVLGAAALVLADRDEAAMTRLAAAAEADRVVAREAWSNWASTADLDGGALAAARQNPLVRTAVRAQAEHALGSDPEARKLADQVIDASTSVGQPQIAAYRLRARLPGRSPQEQASDLVSAVVGLLRPAGGTISSWPSPCWTRPDSLIRNSLTCPGIGPRYSGCLPISTARRITRYWMISVLPAKLGTWPDGTAGRQHRGHGWSGRRSVVP